MTSEQARLLTGEVARWKMAAEHSDSLHGSCTRPLISHYPSSVLLLIQAASQSHLALTLCQHCTRFMGKHYSHLSLKDIFW